MNDLMKLAIDGPGGMWRAARPVPRGDLDHRRDLGPQGKDPDGFPVRDSVSVAIDITDVAFSWEHTHARIVTQPSQVRDRYATARSG